MNRTYFLTLADAEGVVLGSWTLTTATDDASLDAADFSAPLSARSDVHLAINREIALSEEA